MCLGLGVLLVFPVTSTIIVTDLGPQMYGVGSGINAFVMQAAQTMAVPLAAASWSWFHSNGLPSNISYLVAAAECIVSAGIFFGMTEGHNAGTGTSDNAHFSPLPG